MIIGCVIVISLNKFFWGFGIEFDVIYYFEDINY